MLAPVLVLLAFTVPGMSQDPDLAEHLVAGWTVLSVIASIIAVVNAVRLVRRRDLDALCRSTRFVKLASIPFFVGNFLFAMFFVSTFAFFGLGILAAPSSCSAPT